MREHIGLYRGKVVGENRWIQGNLLTFLDGRVIIHYYVEGCRVSIEVDPDTIGECTGLKDKNGKLIFEGDIVEDAEIGLLGVVVFSTVGVPSFGINEVDDGLQYHDGFWHDIEIIGTIHDNPELLKGGEG